MYSENKEMVASENFGNRHVCLDADHASNIELNMQLLRYLLTLMNKVCAFGLRITNYKFDPIWRNDYHWKKYQKLAL